MASIYKHFTNNDIVSTRTLLHEAIPLTGTIVSGTYVVSSVPTNCKNYAHGMFQSVYDYPYLSSSANHIFDISVGVRSSSTSLSSSTHTQIDKKVNIYNQMAQVLMGYDANGSILPFDEDGNIAAGGRSLENVYFLNFSRLLIKDEMHKGSFELELDVTSDFTASAQPWTETIAIKDISGSTGYLVNSPAGEYGILYARTNVQSTTSLWHVNGEPQVLGSTINLPACGLIFYQAGVVVLSGSVFNKYNSSLAATDPNGILAHAINANSMEMVAADTTGIGFDHITGSEISSSADALRHRIKNIQFNNTIELNSTVYFCRANHHEFNYSSNPTYLDSSQIRVKTAATDMPVSYITSIGLYSSDNFLLGVAKLSEPIRKDPNNEFIFRARLDY